MKEKIMNEKIMQLKKGEAITTGGITFTAPMDGFYLVGQSSIVGFRDYVEVRPRQRIKTMAEPANLDEEKNTYVYKDLDNLHLIENGQICYCSIIRDEYKHPGQLYLYIYSDKARTKLVKKIKLRKQ